MLFLVLWLYFLRPKELVTDKKYLFYCDSGIWFNFIFRNQQFEHDSDRLTPLGAGYDGVNFPLRKTGQEFKLLDLL